MFDAPDAVFDEPRDGLAGISMRKNIRTPVAGCLHGSTDFGRGGLQRVDRVVIRHDAAATHDLDLRRAVLEVLAYSRQRGSDTVGEHGRIGRQIRVAARESGVRFMAHAPVSMTGSL